MTFGVIKMGIDTPHQSKEFPLSPKNNPKEKKRRGQHQQQTKLADYFTQNRRSQRKINQALAEKKQKILVQAIVEGVDDGLKVLYFNE